MSEPVQAAIAGLLFVALFTLVHSLALLLS
jgi:hypothetical protein